MPLNQNKSEKILLAAGFAAVISAVFVLGYFDQRGLSNQDSVYFMALARSVSQEFSFFPHGGHVSWWPPLYGILTGLVASLGISDVIWASKVLNSLCFLATAFLLYRISPARDQLVMLAVFPATVITISFYSLSDILFLPLLTLNLYACVRYFGQGKFRFVALMGLSAFLLFMSRYIGVFILSVNGLFLLWMYFRRYSDTPAFLKSAVLLTVSAALMVAYLYFNYRVTGWFTGPRYHAPETFWEYLFQVIRVFGDDINLMMVGGHNQLWLFGVSFIIQLAVFWFIFRNGGWRTVIPQITNMPAILFLSSGVAYLASLLIIRSVTETMHLHYRYTSPGIFLIAAGLLMGWLNTPQSRNRTSRYLLLGLMAVSVTVSVLTQSLLNSQRSDYLFPVYRALVIEQYKHVPERTIILWGEHLINYYSGDVFVTHPYWNNRRTGETWDGFLSRLENMYPEYAVYLQRFDPQYVLSLNQHESVNEALFELLHDPEHTGWLIPVRRAGGKRLE